LTLNKEECLRMTFQK